MVFSESHERSPKAADWDEVHLAEYPAVELLQSLGYTYVPPEDLEPERPRNRSSPADSPQPSSG